MTTPFQVTPLSSACIVTVVLEKEEFHPKI